MTCCQVKSISEASATKGTRTNNQIHEKHKRTISRKEEGGELIRLKMKEQKEKVRALFIYLSYKIYTPRFCPR